MENDNTVQVETVIPTDIAVTETEEQAGVDSPDPKNVSVPYEQLMKLHSELDVLRDELERRDREATECAIWNELYPAINPGDVPLSVTEEAEKLVIPIAAAYAMYERRASLANERARAMNENNRGRSTGTLGSSGGSESAFTLEEIRSMTPAQVKKHYKQIIKSLGGER